jgi:hypothetical protein
LLNWDEVGRGPGYSGWNAAAISHHKNFYGGRPINPSITYPVLPLWLAGDRPPSPSFTVVDRDRRQGPTFRVHG